MTSLTDSSPPAGQPAVPNRLLDVGDIVSGSFRTLIRAPRIFLLMPLGAALGLAIPTIGIFLISAGIATATDGGTRSGALAVGAIAAIVFALAAMYVLLRMVGAFTIGAYRVALGEEPSIGQVWQEARGIVWRFAILALLVMGVALSSVFLIGLIIFASATADSGVGAGIAGLLALGMFPLVFFLSVKFVYTVQALAIEKADPIAALRRSWRLTRGSWWNTFGRLLILYLVGVPLSFVTQGILPSGAFGWDADEWSGPALGLAMVVGLLVSIVANFLYQAFCQVYATIMYLDARRREELRAMPGPSWPAPGGYPQGPISSGGQPYSAPTPYPYGPADGGSPAPRG